MADRMITHSSASGGRRTLAICAALMCTALFLFAALFVCTERIPLSFWISLALSGVGITVCLALKKLPYALALLCAAAATVIFAFGNLIPAGKLDQAEGVFVLRADTRALSEHGTGTLEGTLLSANGTETKKLKLKLFLSDATPSGYAPGDKITLSGKITLSKSLNRLSQNNLLNLSQTGELTLTAGGADRPLCGITRFSYRLGDKIRQYIPGREGALLCALLTGDRGHFDEDFDRSLKKSGLAHIAAVSGMHVSVITALLCMLLGKKAGIALCLPLLPLFAAMTGFSPSVIRAVIMGALAMLAFLSRSRYDPLTAIFSAAAALCAFNPFVMFSPSFLLSFSSTLGIVTVGVRLSYFLQTRVPMRHPLQHLVAKLCATFSVSVAASAFTLPMQLIFFSEVSLNSLLSNLLAVWAVPWAMFMGIFLIPMCALLPFASGVFAFAAALPLRYLTFIVELMGQKLALTARSDNIFLILASLGFVITALIYHRGRITGKACTGFCLLIGTVCLSLSLIFPTRAVYLHGEQGSISMVAVDGTHSWVINAPVSYGGRQFVDGVLNGRQAEALILTSADYRLSGGSEHIDAKKVYSPAPLEDPSALIYAQSGALELGSSRAELIYTDSGAALRLTTPRCTILDVTEISPFDELPRDILCDLLIIDGAFADAPAALRWLCSLSKPSVVYITAADCDLPRLTEICSCTVIWLDECQRVKIN